MNQHSEQLPIERSFVTLGVVLSGGAQAFHRLVTALHRKHLTFTSLTFVRNRALIGLVPTERSVDQVIAVLEREPLVVEVRSLDVDNLDRLTTSWIDSLVPTADETTS